MAYISTLETSRLVLRPFRAEDAGAVAALLDDRNVSATMEAIPYPYRREDADWWIATHAARFEAHGEVHLAIVLRERDEVLGAVGLLPSNDPDGPLQLGYWLGRRHWGRGYATEAAEAIVRHATSTLGWRRIAARCMVTHAASVRVLTKIGFRRIRRADAPVTKGDRTYEIDEFLLEVVASRDRQPRT